MTDPFTDTTSPMRFDPAEHDDFGSVRYGQMNCEPEGDYVRWEDYEKLESAVSLAINAVAELADSLPYGSNEILRAVNVERMLRAANDKATKGAE